MENYLEGYRLKLKAFLTRRRYLVKIASTCIIFLLVPCMVALGLFLGVARGQLESANEEYYHNTTSMFCAYFQSKLYDMRKLANQISLDSRENGNTAYALSRIQPEVNEYYYWNALAGAAHAGKYRPISPGRVLL